MSAEEEAKADAAKDEEKDISVDAAPKEGGDAAAGTNGDADAAGADDDDKKRGRGERKRDETPIEELYDLTKPIPRVDRPLKGEHDKKVKELTEAFEELRTRRQKIQAEIDSAMNDPASNEGRQEAKDKMAEYRAKKTALIEQKKALREQMDKFRNQTDKLVKDRKDARSNIKFDSLKEIEDEIAKLKRKQETTTMSLNEEKKLIKDMDMLEKSKKFVADLKSKNAAMEDVKEQRKSIKEQIDAKDKEINALNKEMDEVMAKIKSYIEKDKAKRDSIQSLFKLREDLKVQIAAKLKEKDEVRATFREQNNKWYNYQRAVRAQKKMQYEEEKRKREEEKAAYLAKIEEEEAKKIPYEEEQALCEYLANYLERTYLKKGGEDKGAKKDDKVDVKEDPFAGFKPVSKKVDDEYFGKGKGKKKRVRATKKQDSVAGPFTLSVDSFEQFGLIGLSPPTSIDQVEKSVQDLREKKEWFKKQPRGSVPTAAEIRKANEKVAAKLRQAEEATSGDGPAKPQGGKKGGFALSNDDFAPLTASASTGSAVNSSWGQKPVAAADGDAEEAPAEEAEQS